MDLRSRALSAFDALPLAERLFVRGRLSSAPLEAMAERAAGRRVIDVGCGHGALVALLAAGACEREVLGVDPDARKIAWARESVGRWPRVAFEEGSVEVIAKRSPASFDTVFVADVLYLLPPFAWPAFLTSCRRLLASGGRLVIKEAEDDGSWRVTKALWQERLMVKLLRRTKESGAVGFEPRETLLRALELSGFAAREVESYAKGYSTPHLLVVAQAV